MTPEIVLLLLGPQTLVKPAQSVCRKQFGLSGIEIRLDYQMRLNDLGNLLLFDTTRGMIGGPIFWNGGPVEGLGGVNGLSRLA